MFPVRRLGWLPLALWSSPAAAHSPVPGIEGFYVGLLHPFSTPEQALLMAGLGLLVGSFALDRIRWFMGAFLAITLAALISGFQPTGPGVLAFAMAFLVSGLAALLPGRFAPAAFVAVALGAALIGFASIPDDGPVRDRVITMMGSFVGANLGLLYLAGGTFWLRERYVWPWVDIAFRVAAAWLAAISLLMLALSYATV